MTDINENWKKNIMPFLASQNIFPLWLYVGSVCNYLVYYLKNTIRDNDDHINNVGYVTLCL